MREEKIPFLLPTPTDNNRTKDEYFSDQEMTEEYHLHIPLFAKNV